MGCYLKRTCKFDMRYGTPVDRDRLLRFLMKGKWGYDQTLTSVSRYRGMLMVDPEHFPHPTGFAGVTRQH